MGKLHTSFFAVIFAQESAVVKQTACVSYLVNWQEIYLHLKCPYDFIQYRHCSVLLTWEMRITRTEAVGKRFTEYVIMFID